MTSLAHVRGNTDIPNTCIHDGWFHRPFGGMKRFYKDFKIT